eukprot:gene7512-567_t
MPAPPLLVLSLSAWWRAFAGHAWPSLANSRLFQRTKHVATAVSNKSSETLEITKYQSHDGKYAPTAVLLGWVGCEIKHLRKYAAVYKSLRINTVCGIMPASYVFHPSSRPATEYSKFVLDTLAADPYLYKGGLILSPFSNGGCFAFRSMVTLLNSTEHFKKLKDAVVAFVCDSAPCYMTIPAGSKALCASLRVVNPILRGVVFISFAVCTLLISFWGKQTPTAFWNAMQTWHLGKQVHEIYFVSDADELLDLPRLQSLVEKRISEFSSENNPPIQLVLFPGSPHVRHLQTYPDKDALRSMLALACHNSKSS